MDVKTHFYLRLINSKGEPFTGMAVHVKLYDQDIVSDDYLGGIILDAEGKGSIVVTPDKYRSLDSPFERYPDVYFKVFKGDEEVFKSHVIQDIDVEKAEIKSDGSHIDLGSFVVE